MPIIISGAVLVVIVYMAVGFMATCAISAYYHLCCEFKPRSWRGVLDIILGDKVCQWLATDRWFSPDTPVSFTNKTDGHHITEILLKVALNNITIIYYHFFLGKYLSDYCQSEKSKTGRTFTYLSMHIWK